MMCHQKRPSHILKMPILRETRDTMQYVQRLKGDLSVKPNNENIKVYGQARMITPDKTS